MANIVMGADACARQIELAIRAKKVPFTKGKPGCGKSAMHRLVADKFKLKFIDFRLAQCDPTDLLGFPGIKDGRSVFHPPESFPLEGDPIPEGYDGWYLCLDEANSAPEAVQAAAYKLVLDRAVGQYNLHSKCAIGMAGNREEDGAIVVPMSSALVSRIVHLHMGSDSKSWLKWAPTADIDHRVQSYIEWQPDRINTFDPDKLGIEDTYACERTWEFASDICKVIDPTDPDALPVLSGTIGEGQAREFRGFCEVFHDLPKISAILADPNGIVIPQDPGTLHALTGSIAAHASSENMEGLMTFVNRLPMDFQVVCLRRVSLRDREVMRCDAVKQWTIDNSQELYD